MKLLLKIIAAIVVLIVVAIIALILFFDPNMFKPRIEALAKEQGLALHINGELDWKLWPSLGVEVNDLSIAALTTPDQPIATLQQASLLLAVKPLLAGDVIVHHVLVDGAVIALAVDAQGTGNWEALTTEKPVTADAPADTSDAAPAEQPAPASTINAQQQMQLAVEKISLHNSSLSYSDAQSGQTIAVENIQLDIDKFNLQGQPFDMQLSLLTRVSNTGQTAGEELTIATSLENKLQLAQDFTRAQITEGQLQVSIEGKDTAAMNGSYSVSAADLQNNLTFNGEINIAAFNARKLMAAFGIKLETAQDYALSDVALNTRFSGNSNSIIFDPLQITLDKTHLNGSFAVIDFATTAIKLTLKGDQINIDDYLAPTTEEEAASEPAATGDEELIPLDTVKTLNADISVDFGKITVADMPLENIILRSTAKDGVINLAKAQATAYEGNISANGKLDGRGDTALMTFAGSVDKFQLEPFFKDMELTDKVNLMGAINATANGNTRGLTMNQLINGAVAQAQFSGAQIRLAPLNIEEKFCQFVSLINKQEGQQKDWQDYTEMSDLSGKVNMANGIITVESFNAGVEQLMLGATGTVNLNSDEYDFHLPLKLISTVDTAANTLGATSAQGCSIGSNYWLNRSLSLLRCHGSLSTMSPVSDCRPDSKALTSLTKDYAEFKLREKHGEKIDAAEKKLDEKKDELREKLNKKLGGEDEGKNAEKLLKNLFNKPAKPTEE